MRIRGRLPRPQRMPLGSTEELKRPLRRTRVIRIGLAAALAASLAAGVLTARDQGGGAAPVIPRGSSGVIVLDASYSITPDTYRIIDYALRRAIASGDRWGLVLFSDIAYEALPPGTPARELEKFRRFFVPVGGWPKKYSIEERLRFRQNPWFDAFAGGTRISTGLRLAKQMLERDRVENGAVLLVSDLADSGTDVPSLTQTLIEYAQSGVPLRIIALAATSQEKAFFERLLKTPAAVSRPPSPAAATAARTADVGGDTRAWLIAAAILALALAAVNELWCGRLTWGRTSPGRAAA